MDDPSLREDQRKSFLQMPEPTRQSFQVMTDDEIRESFLEAFESIDDNSGRPWLKVIFNDKRCADCGVIADPRIMPKFCHMARTTRHPEGEPQWGHPEPVARFHPAPAPIDAHSGELVRESWYKACRILSPT